MKNLENNSKDMNTKVATYFVEETIDLIYDNEKLDKWNELVDKMYYSGRYEDLENYNPKMAWFRAKQCALIAVQEILNCNPHSNPFNTNIYSTYDYWLEVKQEIEKL